jgi:aminopeptidase N
MGIFYIRVKLEKSMWNRYLLLLVSITVIVSCVEQKEESEAVIADHFEMVFAHDPHSFADPNKARVVHLDLDAVVDFENRIIQAEASYLLERKPGAKDISFDTDGLIIHEVRDQDGAPLSFELMDPKDILGRELHISLQETTERVVIQYETSPGSKALQWLDPGQTAGKQSPFLFTQSQAILARTWLPCQDSPGIRYTYKARVRVPEGMLALMSATNPTEVDSSGVYTFTMDQPIPSYLMAMAVGRLDFRSVGAHTGVYAEPELIEASAYEFAEMEQMLIAAEKLYGAYKWERYDLIVLPPSFPFGGMENPRLTFATPTILAGDRSLTALVAHELAHSWSGNLVTNSTWNDFWLNEGFTVYFERRIMEEVYGREYSEMLAQLGYQDLLHTMDELGEESRDTHLKLELENRDPDDGMTDIAYEKGYFFLRMLEEHFGRETFDAFLKAYFTENAFEVMDTEFFIGLLETELGLNQELNDKLLVEDWIYGPGIPENCPQINSNKFLLVEDAMDAYFENSDLEPLREAEWTTHEWLHFLRMIPSDISLEQVEELDHEFAFTTSGNSEILAAWFQVTIRSGYEVADERMASFLIEVGRRKFLTPTYRALLEKDGNPERALEIYEQARPNYHAVSRQTMDELLGYSR